MAAINKGLPVQRKLRIKAYDLLNATNRMTNGRGYEGLKAAFNRLQGTQIETNIVTGGQEVWEVFSIIEKARIVRETRDGRMQEVEVTLSDWVFNAIEAKEVLTLHKDYFRLRKPLERRMYELARKHIGAKHHWSIGMELLRKKTGSTSSINEFKRLVNKIINDAKSYNHFPDFDIANKESNLVIFTRKIQSKVGQLTAEKTSKYTVDNLDQILGLKALTLCRKLAHKKNRDWYQLKSEFIDLLNKNNEERKNISGSFIGFIKSKDVL
jgi:plasmid replication initiation protein